MQVFAFLNIFNVKKFSILRSFWSILRVIRQYFRVKTNLGIRSNTIDRIHDKADDKANDKADDKADDKAHRDREIVINELIIFCSVWRKSSEMARHVGEQPQYISRRIIPEMLKRGILIREYPDSPTHPAQRYRIKPKRGK